MPLTRKHLVVRGRVQGVGYRYFALEAARRLKVTGWVRNRYDGSVEAEAQAEPSVLASFVEDLRRGPRFAAVETLDERPLSPVEGEREFEIR